jgi:CubicO group peptidase (beta-lactamase class C family)
VTVQNLLEFASGFDWHETYEGASPRSSSVLAMLYGEGQADMARFVTGHPLRDPPGTSYMYSSGDSNVLAAIAGKVLSPRYGDRYPWEVLLDPIGMRSAVWERDAAGTYVGSSYLWATPRDLARFGWLLRADGCWNGERILPERWVADSTQVSDAIRNKALAREPGDVQGRQFWLNQRVVEAGQDTLPWPQAPEDAFAALGHWKQSIVVIPSEDIVVVRTGDDRDGTFSLDSLLGAALRLVQEMP